MTRVQVIVGAALLMVMFLAVQLMVFPALYDSSVATDGTPSGGLVDHAKVNELHQENARLRSDVAALTETIRSLSLQHGNAPEDGHIPSTASTTSPSPAALSPANKQASGYWEVMRREWDNYKAEQKRHYQQRSSDIHQSHSSNQDFNNLRMNEGNRRKGEPFVADAIEDTIRKITRKLKDPEIAWLFRNCYPNTVDTTVKYTPGRNGGDPDTFVITGDINAMWLRDSTNQVWPYIPLARQDEKVKDMVKGLLYRQLHCVKQDPYANAFLPKATSRSSWSRDKTKMKGGVHERKYELDSLASVIRLCVGYYQHTGDKTPFQSALFKEAFPILIDTIIDQQKDNKKYTFQRNSPHPTETLLHGVGYPGAQCGLSRSPFRPSDDSGVFPYPIPANAMTYTFLKGMLQHGLLDAWDQHTSTYTRYAGDSPKKRAEKLAQEIKQGIDAWGIVDHPVYGRIYAYEVDGRGSVLLTDDANVPSLLSLPYLGYTTKDDPVYRNTRAFLLSTHNPWFFKGEVTEGIGSPHAHGPGYIWPMSIILRAMTSDDDEEILLCLDMLKRSSAGSGFMHESFKTDRPRSFTRSWFAWVNTLFGELILRLADERPHLIFK